LSYPELYSDERVVLQAQNVKVKSVSFEVVLTTRRLVLIDVKKHSIPPQEINLATLKDVESGENAIRDPTITISIITISGNTRQMVLTFSKTSGGERRRECDEWVRALRQNITSTIYHPVTQTAAPREIEPAPAAQPPAAQPPAAQPPASQPPAPAPHRIDVTSTPPPKKRIEIARPMKKIVEAPPAMPVPVETTSLPTGSFCNRCGNRIPPESAFCNRCGTPVIQDTGSLDLPQEEASFPPQQPAWDAQQVQLTPPPVTPATAEKKERPIEEVIQSIEPLIEDSVPRTTPAPLVPAKQVYYAPPADTAVPTGQVPPSPGSEFFDAAAAQPSEVQWPILSKSATPDAAVPSDTAAPPAAPVAPPAREPLPPSPPRKTPVMLIAVLALVVLAVIAGVYIFMQSPAGTPGVTPTTETTVPATTVPRTTVVTTATTVIPTATPQQVTTPSISIPNSGVWVKVTYPDTFSGSVGTPGRLKDIDDSGDHVYQISTADDPVVVSIRKSDGTATRLAIDVYKNGALIKHAETTAPKGLIEFQAPLKPVVTTTAKATSTP
jgi:hypothetical protein